MIRLYTAATPNGRKASIALEELGLDQFNNDDVRLLPDGRPLEIVVEAPGDSTEQVDVLELIRDTDSNIPTALRPVLEDTCAEISQLETRIKTIELQLKLLAREDDIVTRLQTIPGIGLLSATALVAFVGDIHRFPTGRHFASYLGLTPRESSSGYVRRLGAISKRGDSYIRMLLIHGARSALLAAKRREHPSPLQTWALSIEQSRGHDKAAVALANKIARIVWALEE